MASVQALASRVRLTIAALRSPEVVIDAFGDELSRSAYERASGPHPRFPLVGYKALGVALQPIGGPPGELFAGRRFEMTRRKARKAEKLGYRVRKFDPRECLAEIMAVNISAGSRQGSALPQSYSDPARVRHRLAVRGPWYGVFDADGTLHAYCHVPVLGDYFVYSTILGHAARLEDGIMHLLVRETILAMNRRLHRDGHPSWAMYDMFYSGLDGLREFKRRTGFSPWRVTWNWVERDARSVVPARVPELSDDVADT